MVRQIPILEPDVVIVDIASGGGMEAVSTVLTGTPGGRTVAVVPSQSAHLVVACAAAGVSGIVAGDSSLDDLVAVIQAAEHGSFACAPGIAPILRLHVAPSPARPDAPTTTERLTRRELEIVGLIGDGLSNKQIARALSIEVSTAKNHVHHILQKLGVERRTAALAAVRELERA